MRESGWCFGQVERTACYAASWHERRFDFFSRSKQGSRRWVLDLGWGCTVVGARPGVEDFWKNVRNGPRAAGGGGPRVIEDGGASPSMCIACVSSGGLIWLRLYGPSSSLVDGTVWIFHHAKACGHTGQAAVIDSATAGVDTPESLLFQKEGLLFLVSLSLGPVRPLPSAASVRRAVRTGLRGCMVSGRWRGGKLDWLGGCCWSFHLSSGGPDEHCERAGVVGDNGVALRRWFKDKW